jgi:hypothetical protein
MRRGSRTPSIPLPALSRGHAWEYMAAAREECAQMSQPAFGKIGNGRGGWGWQRATGRKDEAEGKEERRQRG